MVGSSSPACAAAVSGGGRPPVGPPERGRERDLVCDRQFVSSFLLGWILFAIFTVATLGLAWLLAFITRWIINAILLKLTDALTDHLRIDSFGWALLGALMMSALGTLGQWLLMGAVR